jgi:Zn-dependent protease
MELGTSSLHLHWFRPVFDGFLWGLLAMVLHEAGHLVAAVALGIRIKSVALRWKGLCTVREAGPPDKNLLVSLAGPFVNLLLLLLWPLSHRFGLANVCFAAVNLLPLSGSDGERALDCLDLMREQSSNRAPIS